MRPWIRSAALAASIAAPGAQAAEITLSCNQRYFEYLDLLSRGDRSVDVLPIDVMWPSAPADQLVDLSGYVPAGVIGEYFLFIAVGEVLATAVARPSAQTEGQYAQVSTLFWEAAHNTLIGNGSALSNLAWLEDRLQLLRSRAGW